LATIAVIPVRGRSMEPACMALEPLRSKALIDWTIDAALESKSIFEVIVTSPDPDVYEHIKKTYGERVTFDFRDKKTSHENMSYDDAIKDAIRKRRVATVPDAVVCLTVEAPFRSGLYIEKAINTMRIFGTDSLIAVVPDNNLFYSHDGTGLFSVGINEKVGTLFLERDYIYRQAGGMFLVRHETYMRDDYKYPSKGIGHIVLSKMAGIKVASDEELFVAEALLDRADCERQRKAALAEQSSFKKRT
jgi:CMP-N-acetylneuraminic acid synthetase